MCIRTVKGQFTVDIAFNPIYIIYTTARFQANFDDYSVIMIKALGDRLAEVCILLFYYLAIG